MAQHNKLGSWGELVAREYLIKKGYAILETNWKLHRYEIDIIAMHNKRIVFIEVKTRSNHMDDPLEAVDKRRASRMVVAANTYIQTHDYPHEIQYDIIAITGTPNNYTLEHIPDAFLAPLRTYR